MFTHKHLLPSMTNARAGTTTAAQLSSMVHVPKIHMQDLEQLQVQPKLNQMWTFDRISGVYPKHSLGAV